VLFRSRVIVIFATILVSSALTVNNPEFNPAGLSCGTNAAGVCLGCAGLKVCPKKLDKTYGQNTQTRWTSMNTNDQEKNTENVNFVKDPTTSNYRLQLSKTATISQLIKGFKTKLGPNEVYELSFQVRRDVEKCAGEQSELTAYVNAYGLNKERSFSVGNAAWNKQSFRFTATATEHRINFHCTSNTVNPKCCPLIDNVAVQVVNSYVIPIDSLLIPFFSPGIALPNEEISMKLDGLQVGWKYRARFNAWQNNLESCKVLSDGVPIESGSVTIGGSSTTFAPDTSGFGQNHAKTFDFTATSSNPLISFQCTGAVCCPYIYGLEIAPREFQ